MIEWKKLWEEFDEWYGEKFDPTWNAQKRKIEQLVKKYHRESKKENHVQA